MPRPSIIKLRSTKNCPLCAANSEVDYKDVMLLRRCISERGKILGRVRTGVCAQHQRQVRRAIARARIMALLPFSQT